MFHAFLTSALVVGD